MAENWNQRRKTVRDLCPIEYGFKELSTLAKEVKAQNIVLSCIVSDARCPDMSSIFAFVRMCPGCWQLIVVLPLHLFSIGLLPEDNFPFSFHRC